MKTVAIVQARMGSTRLPNKVMREICGTPMIGLLLKRLAKSTCIDQIVLATSVDPKGKLLVDYVESLGYTVFQGSENDVLERYYEAAKQVGADTIIRITGDCPLVDPQIVDGVIKKYQSLNVDFVNNANPPTFPDGLDAAVFSFAALERAHIEASSVYDRENVTSYIRMSEKFNLANYANRIDFSLERWTVDEIADFEVVSAIFEHFHPRENFSWTEVLELRKKNPNLFAANLHILRDEGAEIGTGQKLWKRAKTVIPGGNMLLSKRAEMFLPDQWPAYFSRAKGCRVWDLDGTEYIDMSIMGVGTNTLGYGHPEVDDAIRQTISAGNMSSFNCPEEVALAERLIEMHPWADMARFSRAGGEANAIAIRIARAASGRDKVAICGYHGWHDWYLAANLGDNKNLDGHLLPGLQPKGVPKELRGSVLPFHYNNFPELEALVNDHDIGVIKMEVSRNMGPEDRFLENVRKLATDNNIVLVFDECTSGFRQSFGGLHKLYGVEPDMAIFGKALGNGYAITAILGKGEIMQAAQSSFISSTFWTERIGPTAALKTLEVMEREKSWETITATGTRISEGWVSLAEKHGLKLQTSGMPAISAFGFLSPQALQYKTLITQEMLAKGYLASNVLFACTEHNEEVIEGYFHALDPVFATIAKCEDGLDVSSLLKGPVCHAGFKRLN